MRSSHRTIVLAVGLWGLSLLLITAGVFETELLEQFWLLRLRYGSEGAQEVASEKLAAMRSERAVVPLLEVLAGEARAAEARGRGFPDTRRHYATRALERIGERAVPHLIEVLSLSGEDRARDAPRAQRERPPVPTALQRAAMGILETIGAPAIPLIVQALEHRSAEVRMRAAQVLATIGGDVERLALPVGRLLQDPERDVRLAAAATLENFGPAAARAAPALLTALGRGDRFVDRHAAFTLRRLEVPPEDAVPAFTEGLRSADAVARRTSAAALGEIGPPAAAAVPALVAALDDRQREVASEAALALGRIGEPAAVPGLVEALSHGDPTVRRRAVVALGRIGAGDVRAVGALEESSREDDDEIVRREAAAALAGIREGAGGEG